MEGQTRQARRFGPQTNQNLPTHRMRAQDPLLLECQALALRTQSLHFPRWTRSDLAEAEQFFCDVALSQAERVAAAEDDRGVVARAVRYLARFAVPENYEPWFRERLAALLELACPTQPSPLCGEPFFQDLCSGMNRANEWGIRRTALNEYQAIEIVEEEISEEQLSQSAR